MPADSDDDDDDSDSASLQMNTEGGVSDGEEDVDDVRKGRGPRTKNETEEEDPGRVAPEEIQAHDEIGPCGEVLCTLEEEDQGSASTAVIQAPDGTFPLDEGSVLCLLDRTPVGRVRKIGAVAINEW